MEENNTLLQEDSLVVENEPQATVGYKKRIEISEDKKKTEGISVWTIIGKALMYIFLVIFALWTLFPLLIGLLGSLITKHDASLPFTGRDLFPLTKNSKLLNWLSTLNTKLYTERISAGLCGS